MKNILFVFGLFVLAAVFFVACNDDDFPTQLDIALYDYASLDENGGQWRPVLLSSADQIAVPVPAAVTSPAYQAELEVTRSAAAGRNADQEAAAHYWGVNSTVRWNEIARELAAKYNLIPAPNADGTYPAPNPANPGEYPLFPFAHPPYTARMLAYLSAAQFDALIATWHYKYAYERPAPYVTDPSIPVLLPKNDLPAYPAHEAVVAAVSEVILTVMFPLEKDYIAQKAAEHKQSLIWAGVNVQSDIFAGDSLGRAVAGIFLARASADGMKQAQASRQVSDSLRDAAQEMFGWHWENLESPQRPVGLTPLFGQVKTWCLPDVTLTRPPVPPAPGSPEFETAAQELRDVADNLTTDQRAIANFWSDGFSTYTPPGHWNRLACEYLVNFKMNPLRSTRVMAYMNMAIMDAGISCWDAKYYYHYPRPSQAIPGFKTILGIPNFPAYTSGHSAFSASAAAVLSHFFPADAPRFDAWAQEAAESRIYGGIHYRFDAEAGITQGKAVAVYAIQRAQADGAE